MYCHQVMVSKIAKCYIIKEMIFFILIISLNYILLSSLVRL